MIRLILTNDSHTIDLRTDAGYSPDVLDDMAGQAIQAITTAALIQRGNDAEATT